MDMGIGDIQILTDEDQREELTNLKCYISVIKLHQLMLNKLLFMEITSQGSWCKKNIRRGKIKGSQYTFPNYLCVEYLLKCGANPCFIIYNFSSDTYSLLEYCIQTFSIKCIKLMLMYAKKYHMELSKHIKIDCVSLFWTKSLFIPVLKILVQNGASISKFEYDKLKDIYGTLKKMDSQKLKLQKLKTICNIIEFGPIKHNIKCLLYHDKLKISKFVILYGVIPMLVNLKSIN